MGFISLGIYLKFFGIYLKFFGIYLKFLVIYLKFMGIYLKFFGIYLKFFGIGHLLGSVWSLWLGSKKSSWNLQKINYCNWTTCCFLIDMSYIHTHTDLYIYNILYQHILYVYIYVYACICICIYSVVDGVFVTTLLRMMWKNHKTSPTSKARALWRPWFSNETSKRLVFG